MQGPFEIYPYRSEQPSSGSQTIERQQLFRRLLWFAKQWSRPKALVLFVVAFLLGRAIIAQQMNPFGLALMAVVISKYRSLLMPVLIILLAGEATVGLTGTFWMNLFTYISLIIALPIIMNRMEGSLQLGLVSAVWAFGVKAGFITIVHYPVAYDYLLLAIEAVVAGALVPPIVLCLRALRQSRKDFGRLQEEAGSILIIVLALLLGLNFTVKEYSVGVIVSKYLVMLASLGGAGWGAAFGGACGLVPGLTHLNGLILAGLYSISGMLGGFLRNWGKPGLLLGFFCGNLIYGFYFSDEAVLKDFLATSGMAGILLLLTPKAITNSIAERRLKPTNSTDGLSCYINYRINSLINLFNELASGYAQASVGQDLEKTWEKWLGGIVNSVCTDCSYVRICWDEKGRERSYGHLRRWLSSLEIEGQEDPMAAVPIELQKRCPRTEELGASLAYINGIEKANQKWQTRLNKERKAVAAQLSCGAKALGAAKEEWQSNGVRRDRELEETVQIELEDLGLIPGRLEVWKDTALGVEAYLEFAPCQEGKSVCAEQVSSAVSNGLKQPVLVKGHHCPQGNSQENCYFRFLTMTKDSPEIGIAQCPKEGYPVCGDSVAATALSKDRWLFILSDGMGSGEPAFRESSGVIKLLEQFLLLDFTLLEAVELVNGLLLLNSEERFATVDLAVLDLTEKTLNFAKIGAVPSLLINQGNCRVLESNNLPVGIIEDITVETVSLQLESGTVLIMVTDGIWQGPAGAQQEGWLPEFVQGLWHLSPKDLAQRIVEHSMIMHGGKAQDDLSVLVVRVE